MLTRNGYDPDLKWIGNLRLSEFSPAYSTPNGALYLMDAIKLLRTLPSTSVDLVMTSPPFALTRKKEYGNECAAKYLDWSILKKLQSVIASVHGAAQSTRVRLLGSKARPFALIKGNDF